MTDLNDVTLRLSQMQPVEPGRYKFQVESLNDLILAGHVQGACSHFLKESSGADAIELVSCSLDKLEAVSGGGTAIIQCEIERKTRTLIFTSAVLTVSSRNALKATLIYRIAERD